MTGEINLAKLLATISPVLNDGDYVFCSVKDTVAIDRNEIVGSFKEVEGLTYIIQKNIADSLNLSYHFVCSWITLTVHSSLEAVGLTAAFSNALSKEGISCNVVAAYYHDHIFVAKNDAEKAMEILQRFSTGGGGG